MGEDYYMSSENIEKLLRTSKDLQSKFQHNLSRHTRNVALPESGKRKGLTQIWDNGYAKNMVTNYLWNNFELVSKREGLRIKSNEAPKGEKLILEPEAMREIQLPDNIEIKNDGPQSKYSFKNIKQSINESSKVKPMAENTPNIMKPFQKTDKINVKNITGFKMNKLHLKSKSSVSKFDKSCNQEKNDLLKCSFSENRFPLQRFSENINSDLDFFRQHPTLEIETSPKQTTLFPRRFCKKVPTNDCEVVAKNKSINSVDSTVHIKPVTWNDMLLKNSATKIQKQPLNRKSGRIKLTPPNQVADRSKSVERKDRDIILVSSNGSYHFENRNMRKTKERKCRLQHFPVLYLRPERQVQQVVNISIHGDNDKSHKRTSVACALSNVKYTECVYRPETLKVENSLPLKETVPCNESRPNLKNENKFFKALEFSELRNSSMDISSAVSQLNDEKNILPPKIPAPPMIESTDSYVTSASLTWSLPRCKYINKRQDVYVQTDNKCSRATSPLVHRTVSPPRILSSSSSSPPTPIQSQFQTMIAPNLLLEHENKNPNEDDIITDIFKRIQKDSFNAQQILKDHNSISQSENIFKPALNISPKQRQEQMIKEQVSTLQHQILPITNASDVECPPKEIKQLLACKEAQLHDGLHTALQVPPSVKCPTTTLPHSSETDESYKFLLLQQNPLFVQTINRIKSSAVHDAILGDGRTREKADRRKYLTNAEIKRAVKIFLDSLTLRDAVSDGDKSNGRKSIITGVMVGKKLAYSSLESISTRYSDSNSSKSSSSSSSSSITATPTANQRRVKGIKEGSNMTWLDYLPDCGEMSFTDLELEKDEVDKSQSTLLHLVGISNLSEGEVLSVGEISQ